MSERYRWLTIGLDLGQRGDPTALAMLETQVYLPNIVHHPKPVGATSVDELVHIVQQQQRKPSGPAFSPGWQSPESVDPSLLKAAIEGRMGPWPQRPVVHVRSLKRYPLQTRYPDIVADVKRLMNSPLIQTLGGTLVIDGTGVGIALTDLFFEAGLEPVPITIHGGNAVSRDDFGGGWRVPKRDLVSSVQALLQTGRIKVASSLPEAAILEHEMANFKVTIDPRTAHDSYAAWRENDHDDMLLALAVAAWYRESYWQHYDRALVTDPNAA